MIRDDAAYLWIWDKDVVDREIASARVGRRNVDIFPETLLHGAEKEGSRLVTCLDGVEGQIWQRGTLSFSRWWPDAPDLARWNAFIRDSGQPAATSVPATCETTYAAAPWAVVDRLTNGGTVRHERSFVLAGVSVLSAVTAWFLVQSVQLSGRIEEEKGRLTELEQNARPIQQARQQALDSRERIEFLRGFNPYPTQTVLQAEVGKRLPKDGTFIKNWDFQAGRLRLTLVSPNKLQASSLIKTYQEAGWFKDVQAPSGSDPNLLVLEMSVLRLAEINPELVGQALSASPRTSNPPSKSS